MKRALSIVLLIIFLFNLVGYYGVHWVSLQYYHTETLRKLNANDYAGFETVMLRIPLTVPYPAASQDYERIDGAFEHQGGQYKLVKQKLENDTLYTLCIRDRLEEQLQNSLQDFIKLSHDHPATSKTLKLLNSFCKDFQSAYQPDLSGTVGWWLLLTYLPADCALQSGTHAPCTPPPRLYSLA